MSRRAQLRQKGRPPQGDLFALPPPKTARPALRAPGPRNRSREASRRLIQIANGFLRP